MRCIENNIAIYSPHTALDSVKDGLNDFLAEGLLEGSEGKIQPIVKHKEPKSRTENFKVVTFVPADKLMQLREKLAEEANCGHIGNYTKCSFEVEGNGRFFAGSKTKPAAGNKEQDNCEKEVRQEDCKEGEEGRASERQERGEMRKQKRSGK